MRNERIKQSFENIGFVLSKNKYLVLTLISGFLMFFLLYYLMVAKVADQNLRVAIMMSGAEYITLTIVGIFLISGLFGIYISLLVFKIVMQYALGVKGIFGAFGSLVGAFGVGCPTCGAVLFGLIGFPLALTYFPFRGMELMFVGVLVMMFSIYLISVNLVSCKTKTFK